MRLAGVSALLTFVILCGFAVAIGSLTVHRIRNDFNPQVANAASRLPSYCRSRRHLNRSRSNRRSSDFASDADHAVIKVLTVDGTVVDEVARHAAYLGTPLLRPTNIHGYRVVSRAAVVFENGAPRGRVIVQYGQRLSDNEATVKRVELFLLLGVLAGQCFALLAGMAIARRAMKPIAQLT